MSKVVVQSFLAATAALTLFLFLLHNIKTTHRVHGPHGLNRRLGFKVPPTIFDPLVGKIERLVEEKGLNDRHTPTNWKNSPVPKELDIEGVTDFLSDDGTLNITLRLKYLFPSLDKDPQDGFVESKDLEAWIMQQANDRLAFRAGKELATRDKDGDAAISFREYFPHFTDEDLGKYYVAFFFAFTSLIWLVGRKGGKKKEIQNREIDSEFPSTFRFFLPTKGSNKPMRSFSNRVYDSNNASTEINGMGHGEAGWWREQFRNADIDQNGLLNSNEFKDFLYPEDSNNEEIQKWLLREKIKPIDYDHDDKLNLGEFRNGAYDIYKNYVEFENGGANAPSPEEIFDKLDVKKDKLLGVEELKPILQYLSPGELSYAKYYASYLIREADEDGDGKLTLDEMIMHEYMFYSSVFDDADYDDYDDEYLDHEEL